MENKWKSTTEIKKESQLREEELKMVVEYSGKTLP